LRRRHSGLLSAPGKLRHHDRRQNAQDDQYQEQFDQREGALPGI